MWEENIKFSQDLNGIEAAKISYSGSVFSSLSLWALSFPDVSQKEKLRDRHKSCPYYVFRLFESKGGKSRRAGTWS